MKKFILIASSVSILCAGPVITPLVDYDQQDIVEAETTVEQKLILPETKPPVVTTPGVRKKSFAYELDLLAGRNFADNGSVLKDANTIGIRLNKYITDDVAIQIGYDRIFDASYKFKSNKNADKNTADDEATGCPDCPAPACPSCNPNDDQNNGDNSSENGNDGTDQGNNGSGDDTENGNNGDQNDGSNNAGNGNNGDQNGGSNDTGNGNNGDQNDCGDDAGNGDSGDQNGGGDSTNNDNQNGAGNGNDSQNGGNTGSQGTQNPISDSGIQNATRSTDVDRFYINVLKEIHSEKTYFIPYFFAGLGYEHVNDKSLGIDSQGFFNTGGGLKYSLNEKFRLVSEAKVIKKFKNSDLDIVAMLGVGILFGEKEQQSLPNEPKITEVDIAPQQQDLSLIIREEAPIQIAEALPALDVTEDTLAVELPVSSTPASKHAYYVQVAVVSTKNAMDNYIQRLEKYGLSYEIKSFHSNGKQMQRILAGPYMSRAEAKQDLPSVKRVEKSAFIKKI